MKARTLQKKEKVSLPAKDINLTTRCPRCYIPQSENMPTYSITPAIKLNRFMRRLLKKADAGNTLTLTQQKFLKNYKKQKRYVSILFVFPHFSIFKNCYILQVIKCGICNKESKKSIPNIIKTKHTKTVPTETPKPKLKKKKKSDRFSGLNKEAVLSVTPKSNLRVSSSISNFSVDLSMENAKLNRSNEDLNDSTAKLSAFAKSMIKNKEKRRAEKKILIQEEKKQAENKHKMKKLNSVLLQHKSKINSPAAKLKMFLQDIS